MHITDEDVPLLLSLADMDRKGIFYRIFEDSLVHQESGEFATVTPIFEHIFLHWHYFMEFLFTEAELLRIHRCFGHPEADKIYNLLKRSALLHVKSETHDILEKITRRCKPCQELAPASHRFNFTLCDDKEFNHITIVDIFYIEKKPLLHVVDESTHYRAVRWLPNVTADAV